MSVYYPANCDDLVPDHICDPCEEIESGGIRSIAYIKNTVAFVDPSNPTEWETEFAAGNVILIPQTRGSFNGGTPTEGVGYGDQLTRLTGYTFELIYHDPNYRQNCTFYNILKSSRQYKLAYRTGTQIHMVDATVQAIPTNPVEEALDSALDWNINVKWSGSDVPCPYDAPPGIFDACIANG